MDKVTQLKNAIEFAKQNPDSPQSIQLRRRLETGMYNRELAQIKQDSQPKPDGFIKSIAKDVAGTLLVKPAARTAEAVGRTGILGENIKKGYEEMSDAGGQNIAGIKVGDVGMGADAARQITGEALKTASYLFPYGKVAGGAGKLIGSKIAGNVVSGATGGYLADAGYGLTDKEQTVGEALTPGLGTAIGAAVPLVGPTLRGTGRALEKVGGKTVEMVIPTSTREAGILQAYKANKPFLTRVGEVLSGTEKTPQTGAKTVLTTNAGQKIGGLFGTKSQIGVQAKRAEGALWKDIISPRLKASEKAVDMEGFFNKIQDDIVKTTPEVSRQKSLLNALQSFKDDYAGINSVSLEKLQKLKEGWAEFIPEKAYKGENIAGAANQVRKLLSHESRQTIYNELGDDVKQAYFDYGNLQGLKKMGQVSMTGQKLKGGSGSFVSEILSQAITPIGTVGGQAIYKIGKGVEFVGNLGAKTVGQALGVQGGLKFPGDKAIDDISKRFSNATQEAKTPIIKQATQTKIKIPKISNISKSIAQTVKKVQSLPNEGTSLNIGMNIGDGKLKLTQNQIVKEIERLGIKIKNSQIKQSNTESTFIPELSRALTKKELFNLSKNLKQDAIAQFSNGKGLLEGPKAADWGGKFNPEYYIAPKANILKGKGVIPKQLDSLAQEARKYKSAEEFEKAYRKNRVWHGTNAKFEKFDPNMGYKGDIGTWFTPSSEIASQNTNRVIARYVKPNLKLATETIENKILDPKEIMAKGYRGIRYPDGNVKLYYPNEDTMSKSQLTDIYNKAKKK